MIGPSTGKRSNQKVLCGGKLIGGRAAERIRLIALFKTEKELHISLLCKDFLMV